MRELNDKVCKELGIKSESCDNCSHTCGGNGCDECGDYKPVYPDLTEQVEVKCEACAGRGDVKSGIKCLNHTCPEFNPCKGNFNGEDRFNCPMLELCPTCHGNPVRKITRLQSELEKLPVKGDPGSNQWMRFVSWCYWEIAKSNPYELSMIFTDANALLRAYAEHVEATDGK